MALRGKYVEALAPAILQPLLNKPLGIFLPLGFPPSDSEQLYARAVLFLQMAPIQLERAAGHVVEPSCTHHYSTRRALVQNNITYNY